MAQVLRLVGDDIIKINDRLFADFPHGDIAKLTFPNDIVTVKTGKNGNTIYAKNETGNQASLELRVLRGSADDAFLNGEQASYAAASALYVLMNGELVKVLGKGDGSAVQDIYTLTGGIITKRVEATSNVEGDVEQAVSVYTIQFALAPRSLG